MTETFPETISIPFSQFIPLIKDVSEVLIEATELYQTAQHNKRIAKLVLERINAANSAVSLKEDDLHTLTNYTNLQRLAQVIRKMKKFIENITSFNKLQKFLDSKLIESQFNELCEEYDA